MIYCVGLTGNAASGKSQVLAGFKSLGVPTLTADKIAKALTAKNQPAFHAIVGHFGPWILNERGELNRAALRTRMIYHGGDRSWLEQLLHPLIQQQIEAEVTQLNHKPYCVIEIPLLLSYENYPYINRVLVLLADRETQIERLMNRDGCTYDEAEALLAIQPTEQSRRAIADDILLNNDSLERLTVAIKHLHRRYLRFAEEGS